MSKRYLRRSFMAAVGALGVGSGVASGSGEEKQTTTSNTTVSQRQEVNVEQEQRVEVRTYEKERTIEDARCYACDEEETKHDNQLGTLMVHNTSTCQRKVVFQSTGKAAQEGEQLEDQTLSIQVPPKKTCWAGFTGSVVRFEAEPGNIEMRLFQRSESEANHCGGENRVFRDQG